MNRILRPLVSGQPPARLGIDVVAVEPDQRPFLRGQADAVEIVLGDAEIAEFPHRIGLQIDAHAERAHVPGDSKTTQGTPIWCRVKAVASPPMPPPAMSTEPLVIRRPICSLLDAGEADIRHGQALGENFHEGAVEVVAAAIGGLVQPFRGHGDDLGVGHHAHVRDPALAFLLQVRHLAEAFAGMQDVQQLALLGHLDLAFGQEQK